MANITGTSGNDFLQGTGDHDWIDGGDGNDFLLGYQGDDTLLGGGGHDYLYGGIGNDDLSGGTGDDYLQGQNGDDVLVGGDGSDILRGGSGVDTFDGGAEDPDSTTFGDGSFGDRISFYEVAATAGVIADLRTGIISNDGFGNVETMSGIESLGGDTAFSDTFYGNDASNLLLGSAGDHLYGFGGDDLIQASGAAAMLDGGDGHDVLTLVTVGYLTPDTNGDGFAEQTGQMTSGWLVDLGWNAFRDGFGTWGTVQNIEEVHATELNDTLLGGAGDDSFFGRDGHDFLRGNGGNDALHGGGGHDYLIGNQGDDLLDGGDGLDRVGYSAGATGGVTVDLNLQGSAQDTGQGWDTLVGIEHVSGTRFDDVITGDGGDNWLWGGSDGSGVTGNDTIAAGGGNDLVQLGAGNHSADGGDGTDALIADGNGTDIGPAGLTLSLALQGGAQDSGQGLWTLSNFENLSGSFFADRLTGDGNANVLAGYGGSDTLAGGAGDDLLLGDGIIDVDSSGTGGSGPFVTHEDVGAMGDDDLEGGLGDDRLVGGGGSDTARYSGAAGGIGVNLFAGISWGADGSDTFESIENVIGSEHDDFILGNNEANALYGLGGNDTLIGAGGDDVVDGGAGHDYVEGSAGNDQLHGGDDDDYLYGNQGDDLLDGGDGIDRVGFSAGATAGVTVDLNLQGAAQDTGQGWDTLIGIEHVSGTIFDDTLTGDGGDNYLWGGSNGSGVTGNDTISGGDGDDLIEVGAGTHHLYGGNGTDTLLIYGNSTDITADGVTVTLALQGSPQDTEQGVMWLEGFENVSASIHDDHVTGDGGANVLAGYHGSDTLVGAGGNDTLLGDGSITMDTHGTGRSGPIAQFDDGGGAGDDILEGGLGDDRLVGGGGIDTAVYANAAAGMVVDLGAGTASGGDGNDMLEGIENVVGSAFDDIVIGDWNDNRLEGGDGNDVLRGSRGHDVLIGGAGNDFMSEGFETDGPFGDDVYDGGDGIDRVSLFQYAGGVTVDLRLDGVAQNTGATGWDTLIGIEHVTASYQDDTLIGNEADNWFWTFAGNDTLSGNGGNDLFTVSYGTKTIDGGTGIDTVEVYDDAWVPLYGADGITVSLAAQGTAQETGIGAWTLTGIENLAGSWGADEFTGDAGANILAGERGNDTLTGGAGDDVLAGDGTFGIAAGQSGAIELFENPAWSSGAGDDMLDGGAGNDLLVGGGGADTMRGGTGADTFRFTSLADSSDGASDLILDFSGQVAMTTNPRGRVIRGKGEGDKIDLSAIDADTGTEGDQEFVLVMHGFSGTAGEMYSSYDSAANLTRLFLDVDGDAVADMTISFEGNVPLTGADFLF